MGAKDCKGRPIRNRGWDSARKLVRDMKTRQGSLSKALAAIGEGGGSIVGDIYNWGSNTFGEGADIDKKIRDYKASRNRR